MKNEKTFDLRLEPEKRLCSAFDALSLKDYEDPGKESGPVQDNCAQENQR